MAFTDRRSDRNRSAIIVTVAALHGAAIYALMTGLVVDYIPEVITRIEGRNIPADPPPPESVAQPEREKVKPDNTMIKAPRPDTELRIRDDVLTVPEIPDIPLPSLPDGPTYTPELTKPKPQFKAVGAVPKTNPGSWVTTDDYPTGDIRQGHEGTVRFRLAIDARGKVQECRIVASSGHPGLDAATCKHVMRNAKFDAAIDTDGQRVAGSYTNAIRWVIPD